MIAASAFRLTYHCGFGEGLLCAAEHFVYSCG